MEPPKLGDPSLICGEWQEVTTPDGLPYYASVKTRETRWELDEKILQQHEEELKRRKSPPKPTTPEKSSATTPWIEYQTPEGVPYYNNPETGETVWERPEEGAKKPEKVASTSKKPNWKVFMAPNGVPYFVDSVTGTTTWQIPPELEPVFAAQKAAVMSALAKSRAVSVSAAAPTMIQPPSSAAVPAPINIDDDDDDDDEAAWAAAEQAAKEREELLRQRLQSDREPEKSEENEAESEQVTLEDVMEELSISEEVANRAAEATAIGRAFIELLAENGVEKGEPWGKALARISIDPRFLLVSSMEHRKALFQYYMDTFAPLPEPEQSFLNALKNRPWLTPDSRWTTEQDLPSDPTLAQQARDGATVEAVALKDDPKWSSDVDPKRLREIFYEYVDEMEE